MHQILIVDLRRAVDYVKQKNLVTKTADTNTTSSRHNFQNNYTKQWRYRPIKDAKFIFILPYFLDQ